LANIRGVYWRMSTWLSPLAKVILANFRLLQNTDWFFRLTCKKVV
jgi:hypothetical protein